MKKLNILAIVPYPFLPPTCGGDYSSMRLFNALGKQQNVTLFTCEPFSSVAHLHFDFEMISYVKFKPQRYINLFLVYDLLRLIKSKKIDAIFMEQPWFWGMAFFLKLFSGKPMVMRSNNIEFLRFKSVNKWWWWFLFVYERWCLRGIDYVFFVTEEDRNRAIKYFGIDEHKTLVTPYGIDRQEPPVDSKHACELIRARYNIKQHQRILLFFGSLDYPPNREALDVMLKKVLPLLEKDKYVFMVCGRRAQPDFLAAINGHNHIIHAGFVEDIDHYVMAADVVVNPILSGGGIKTKAVDALALNKIVVSTQTGAEGIDPNICGQNLIVISDNNWQAFAEAINIQIDNTPAIPQDFYTHFSWKGIAMQMGDKINALIK